MFGVHDHFHFGLLVDYPLFQPLPFDQLSVALDLSLFVLFSFSLLLELRLHGFLLHDCFPTHLLETVILSDSLTGSALYLFLLSFEEFKPILKDLYLVISLFFLEVDEAHLDACWDQSQMCNSCFAVGRVSVGPLFACGLPHG